MKARGDSFLKTLPDELQERVWQELQKRTQSRVRSIILSQMAEAVSEWEKEHGARLAISGRMLTEFAQWYPLRKRLQEAAGFCDQLKAELKQLPELKLDDQQLSQALQVAFEVQAARERDPRLYIGLRRLRNADAELSLARARFESMERRQAEAKEKMLSALNRTDRGGVSAETRQAIEEALNLL